MRHSDLTETQPSSGWTDPLFMTHLPGDEESLQLGGTAANDWRQVDVCVGREAKKRKALSVNDYRLISLFMLPLKGEGGRDPHHPHTRQGLHLLSGKTHTHMQTHCEHQPPLEAPIGRP